MKKTRIILISFILIYSSCTKKPDIQFNNPHDPLADNYTLPWKTLKPMLFERCYFTAETVNHKIYMIGAASGYIEEYDPVNEESSIKLTASAYRSGLASSVVNNKIYLIGGMINITGTDCTNLVEEYDPVNNTITCKTPMPTARAGLACVAVEGKIYAIGGYDRSRNILSTVEEYNPDTDTWTTKTPMSSVRCYLSCTVYKDKIYAVGGSLRYNSYNEFSDKLEVYDPINNTWSYKASISSPRGELCCKTINNKIYVFGGKGFFYSPVSIVQEYDPENNSWKEKTPIKTDITGMSSAVFNNKIYIIGGYQYGPNKTIILDLVEEYDPSFDQ
ncbi:MAG: kelch repeat-containing protein [bacterium]|nr:kelch repeat-containing protein [bacterium]